jgi:hypothetical protein
MLENFKAGKLTVKEVKWFLMNMLKEIKLLKLSYSVSFKVPSKLTHGPKEI